MWYFQKSIKHHGNGQRRAILLTGDRRKRDEILKLVQKGQRKKNQKVDQKTIKKAVKTEKKPYDFKKLSNKVRE